LGTTLIFMTNLHHLAIGAIAGSYRMLPPSGHLPTSDMAQLVIQLTSSSFALGFQLAAPFLVFGFAVYAGLGVLAKLMPQLQIFFVAVPLNIMCGFLILLALIGSLMTVFLTYYTNSMATFL
jgi:flagellar biosynthetic protein FliR